LCLLLLLLLLLLSGLLPLCRCCHGLSGHPLKFRLSARASLRHAAKLVGV